jgi:hypothetical protein
LGDREGPARFDRNDQSIVDDRCLSAPSGDARLSRRRLLVGAGAAATVLGLRPNRSLAAAPSWFDVPFGAWVAGDMPRAYPIGAGRTLWVTNDSFLGGTSGGSSLRGTSFVRNAAFVELSQRLAVAHQPDQPFLGHDGDPLDRWWWFHGGVVVGDALLVFVTEMVRTGPKGWAINFVYDTTWVATIATSGGRVRDLRPAPNSGTRPVYGFSVASDDRWTYLFGNSALYGDGTTENFVARVPLGKLLTAPTYWDGTGWSVDPDAAVSIHTSGTYAYRLHVFRHGRRWLATCKADEFYGDELHVLEAAQPTGPWTVIARQVLPTVTGDDRTCTYDVQATPTSSGRLRVWWSNNAFAESDVRADPARYRPRMMSLDV